MTIEELLKKTASEVRLGDHTMQWDGETSEWKVILSQKKGDGIMVFSGSLELALAILEKMGK